MKKSIALATLIMIGGLVGAFSAHAQTATGTLVVVKNVVNNGTSDYIPGNFILGIVAPGLSTTTVGSATGTSFTVNAGAYAVVEATTTGIRATFSPDCTGTIAGGQTVTCTVTNTVLAAATTTPTTTPTVPNTGGGGQSLVYLYTILGAIALGGVGLFYAYKRA